ncbi:GIY-YIG nuclease family protein [Serratia proteamaculans]|uniref:GIY-YIG nuclease family protein n=1 Tax=Serratia proteamaculans TaxID=28151 RepID=UPI0039AFC10C
MRTLGLILREDNQSWIRTLADVKGIYLLTDEEGGKLYVGKADGADGLWGRWMSYLRTGHGGNVGLIEAFGDLEATRLNQVKFSVLEVMDLNSAQGEIERCEAHWKRVLLTRRYGHNRN